MVFGWGKKNKEPQIREKIDRGRTVDIDEISVIVEDTLKMRYKTLVSESSALHSQMTNLFTSLEKIISKLDGDDLKIDDVDRNVRIIVERGKKQVIKIAKEESKKPLPKISNPEDIEKFVIETGRRIKRTGDALGRHSRVINFFAKKYADQIKSIMKELESDFKDATKLSKDRKTWKELASVIIAGLNEMDELHKTSDSKLQRIKEANAESAQAEMSLKKTKEEISALKSSDHYTSYVKGCKKLDEYDDHVQQVRSKINEKFTKISRPLVKYEYVSAMDKKRKAFLATMCKDPYLVLNEASVQDIQSILSTVRAGVVGGTVSVKDIDRSAAAIDEISTLVPEFVKSNHTLKSEREKVAIKVAGLFDVTALESLESSASRIMRRLEDQKARINNIREESESALHKIPETLALLQKNLRALTGISYTIHTPSNDK
ncbi:MAG: hypothetical protein K8823_880 [Cenarchaeum symbiont of Oopsacas minuta]|nr:hypothetical protein [Cenarchaeum symbiont of Oopsacas minuta]